MKLNPLAEFLKNKRIGAGLTQFDVAKQLGYSSPQFVSNWERGLSSPPIKTLKKLGSMYGASPNELYKIVLEVSIEDVTQELRNKFFSGDKKKRAK